MIFNSVTYLLFLAIVVPLYWVLPRTPRLWLVFLSSLVFYGFWRVEYIALLLVSSFVDYAAGLAMHATQDPKRRRLYLVLSLTTNLGFLFYFKYLIFFAESGTGLLRFLGFDVAPPSFSIVLPLGISFYTFHTIGYVVDVYRGLIQPERNYVLYGGFVTFFPHLVAGPILRAKVVIPQLDRRVPFALDDFVVGLRRVCVGLFLKVVLADNLAPEVDAGFALPTAALPAIDVWTLAFLFGFQIYFDFSGYSHIALGSRADDGHRVPRELRLPLSVDLAARVLAPLAHLAVELDPRLPLPAARIAQPRRRSQGAAARPLRRAADGTRARCS